jgi:hypothetical protein
MTVERESKVVKKTVALNPIMDLYVRKLWSWMIELGYDATYSTALNFMLLIAVVQASGSEGLSQETKDVVWAYARNRELVKALDLEGHVTRLREMWGDNANQRS